MSIRVDRFFRYRSFVAVAMAAFLHVVLVGSHDRGRLGSCSWNPNLLFRGGIQSESERAVNRYVGHRIQKLRKQRRLSSQEVARRTGLAPGSYSCLENGWYRISLENLFRILQVLDVHVTEMQ